MAWLRPRRAHDRPRASLVAQASSAESSGRDFPARRHATQPAAGRRRCPSSSRVRRRRAARRDPIEPLTAALGEHNRRHAAVLIAQMLQDRPDIGQRKHLIRVVVSKPPQVSKIISASAPCEACCARYSPTACALIANTRCRRSGRAYNMRRTLTKSAAAGAFDHVARQRKGAAGEPDQGHASFKPTLDGGHRVKHIPQAGRSGAISAEIAGSSTSGRSNRGPSPSANARPRPMASGTVRMSEKRIAASSGNRARGCSVTSAASAGRCRVS